MSRDSGPNDGLRYRPAAATQVDQVALEIVRYDNHDPVALQREPFVELQQESGIASSEAAFRGGPQQRTVNARQFARQHHRFSYKLRRSQFLHSVLRMTEREEIRVAVTYKTTLSTIGPSSFTPLFLRSIENTNARFATIS